MVSQREKDLARREQKINWKPWAIVAGLALAVIVVAALWPDDTPESRAANVAAFGLADDPFMGDPDAPLVLVGYESPHCSACAGFHRNVLPDLQPFLDSGELVYYYIAGQLGNDLQSSASQECIYQHAGNAGFWRATDLVYSGQLDWPAIFAEIEGAHNLTAGTLQSCVDAGDGEGPVKADWRVGRTFGGIGTPRMWLFGPTGAADLVAYWETPSIVGDRVSKLAEA